MEELAKGGWVLLILITILLSYFAGAVPVSVKPLDGKCFPDYRPGFGCLVFEKLP